MSKEELHNDLISRLDPETVQKALDRYNRKNSTAGVHTDEELAPGKVSKNYESQPSTPRYFLNFNLEISSLRIILFIVFTTKS